MAMMWNDDMSVGVPVLDEDHKTLIRLLNDYTEALENDEGLMVTDSIFAALGDYVHYHFTREESILEQAGYPQLEEHKAAHRRLETQFSELRNSYLFYLNADAEQRVKEFLEEWLRGHILKVDMDYKPICSALYASGKMIDGSSSLAS